MNNATIKILVVEDNLGDFILVKEYLHDSIPNAVVHHADTLETAIATIENHYVDVILLDLSLPDASGIDTFHQINKRASEIPIIVLTGFEDTDLALETVKYGAQDYIVKDDSNPMLLSKSIKYSIERRKVFARMKKSEEQYKFLFHNNPLPMLAFDKESLRFLMVNEAAIQHYGYSEEDFLSMTTTDLRPVEHPLKKGLRVSSGPFEKKSPMFQAEQTHVKKDGEHIDVEIVKHDIQIDGYEAILIVINDVTARNKARKQLKENEKMLRTISENFPNGAVAILDKDLRYQYTAGREFHIAGVNHSYFDNTIYTSHFPAHVQPQIHQNLLKVFEGESVVFETTFYGLSYLISAVPLISFDKKIDKIVLASQNISSQKEALKKVHFQSNILERLSNYVILTDNDFNITYHNKAADELFGDRLQKLSTKKLSKLFLPQFVDVALDALKEAMHNKTVNTELKCVNAHNHEVWVNGRFSKLFDEENNPIGILCLGRDITVEKLEEQFLRLFESVVTNTNDAILITEVNTNNTSEGKIVYANDAFSKMTGYTPDELVNQTPEIFRGSNTDPKELERLSEAVRTFESCELELLNYKKDGTRFWTNFTIVPVADKKGTYTHWISVQRDVTMRKKNEAEKELLIEELTQNNSDLRQFSYITSHNLRSPLSNLLGIIKLIDTSSIQDPMNLLLIENFKNSTIQLNDTVNDLINVLIIKNKVNAKKEPIQIEKSLEKVATSIQTTIDEFEVEIQTDFSEAGIVEFNTQLLRQHFT